MNETKASVSATPSTSGKRILSEETYNNTTDEDCPPKKKRESAIRSAKNLKMLIQNKLLHYFPKQKISLKKVLSLREEARTETIETLISTGKFKKLDKLYSKTAAAKSHGSTVNVHTIATDESDSNNEPETIPSPDRNKLEPVPKYEPNPTNTTENLGRSKTPLRETDTTTDDSDSNSEPEIIPPPERNRLEPACKNEPDTTINPRTSKTSLPETVDSDPIQISSKNNLNQLKETKSNFKGSQSSLNAAVSTLQNRINNLTPETGTEHRKIADIKHIEDIYNSILDVTSKVNAVFTEKSIQLKKAFESINLFVPEIKKGVSLPTIQQLKENSRLNSDELKRVSSRQKPPSQRKGPSSHARTPSPQQSESSSDSESFSQSPKHSKFSKSKSKCYVAK